jgi:hypothetical protein
LDSTYYGYSHCRCNDGRYGTPPNCLLIPLVTYLSDRTSGPGEVNTSSDTFTDALFGNQRRITGIDTSWVIGSGEDWIRAIHLRFTFTGNWSEASDLLDIYEGTADLQGRRVSSLRGIDNISSAEISVFSTQAVVNFRSRSASGTYFFVDYQVSDACPSEYLFVSSVGCRPLFQPSQGLRMILFVLTSVMMTFTVAVCGHLIKHHQSKV